MPQEQPRNIDFENALTIQLMQLESAGAANIFLEDEARLIGRVCIPDALRWSMQKAPIYILECEMAERIKNCFDDYVPDLLQRYQKQMGEHAGFEAFAEHHRGSLTRIKRRFGRENYQSAMQLLDTALTAHQQDDDTTKYSPFIEMHLRDYYDPMYDYQLSQKSERIVFKGTHNDILDKAKLSLDAS